MFSRRVLTASVPPLASIFGSGFLIIVPVLERTLGAFSVLGIAGVCAFAWIVGTAIRHNVDIAEPLREEGQLDRLTERAEQASDLVIATAYVISVALYLRIMSQYVVEFLVGTSETAQRTLACAGVLLIVGIGIGRGFSGLDLMERLALIVVLVLVTILGGTLFFTDAGDLFGGGLRLPPVPARSLSDILLVLGGIVITVQGFETVRYLSAEYDRPDEDPGLPAVPAGLLLGLHWLRSRRHPGDGTRYRRRSRQLAARHHGSGAAAALRRDRGDRGPQPVQRGDGRHGRRPRQPEGDSSRA